MATAKERLEDLIMEAESHIRCAWEARDQAIWTKTKADLLVRLAQIEANEAKAKGKE